MESRSPSLCLYMAFYTVLHAWQGLEYCYAYGVAAKPPCSFGNALAKFDVAAGEATLWHEPGCIPGEPVMVGRPGAEVRRGCGQAL